MKALKCDNCGGFYDRHDGITRLAYIDGDGVIIGKIDICPGCLNAVIKALDNRKRVVVDPMEDDRK